MGPIDSPDPTVKPPACKGAPGCQWIASCNAVIAWSGEIVPVCRHHEKKLKKALGSGVKFESFKGRVMA